jgi:serine/threonine-protein kinase
MQQLGRYEILAELGRGAMGTVFRARDPRIDRTVAIKTIAVPRVDAKAMEDYRQRFFREARAAGRLSHPGIVTIYDVGEDEPTQTPYIVMEYVDGRTLNETLDLQTGAKMPLNVALNLLYQVAEALDYAHRQGIVHRDIKPANIIVDDSLHAKIADFGIAKLSFTEATLPGHVLGTPAYMSPEQINGKPIDGRSDLFSLGVIAYWLLTGEKPFTGDSITQISLQVVTREPRLATAVDPSLSPDFDYVLTRALAKDPERRYQRGKDMAADLHELSAGRRPRTLISEEPTVRLSDVAATERSTAALLPLAADPKTLPATGRERTTVDQAMPPPGKRSRRAIFLALAAVALALTVAGVLADGFGFNRGLPADLQIVGQYPFHSAQVYIWVDDDLRYHDQLRGAVHPHARLHQTATINGGAIALTLPVRAGTHTVRVRVSAPDDAYDRDTSIPGNFTAYTQKTLLLNFKNKNLSLSWE